MNFTFLFDTIKSKLNRNKKDDYLGEVEIKMKEQPFITNKEVLETEAYIIPECATLNKNHTCNCTALCDIINCVAIKSNYKNVKQKATRERNWAQGRLDELKKRGYV